MNNKTEKNWDEMSYYYEAFTSGEKSYGHQIEMPYVKSLLPILRNKKVLDLGCGSGRFSFEFEIDKPSKILGVDLSETMLDIGRYKANEWQSDVEFIKGDISEFESIINEKYDFIFSSTTTHFIEDLQPLFKQIYKSLEEGGISIISIIHPLYSSQYPVSNMGEFPRDEAWEVRYLDKRKRAYVQPWIEYNDSVENYLCESYHHTLTDYMNAILQSGLKLEKLVEPFPPLAWEKDKPSQYEAYLRTPTYMIFKLSK